MARQEINRQILKELAEINEKWSDQRFFQLLVNLDVVRSRLKMCDTGGREVIDDYNAESSAILKNIQDARIKFNA